MRSMVSIIRVYKRKARSLRGRAFFIKPLNTLFSRQATFPELTSIIAAFGLNFSVRNGKRCDPKAKSGEQNTQSKYCGGGKRVRTSDLWIYSPMLSQLSYTPSVLILNIASYFYDTESLNERRIGTFESMGTHRPYAG